MSNFSRNKAACEPHVQRSRNRNSIVGEGSGERKSSFAKTKAVWRPKVRPGLVEEQSSFVSPPKADLSAFQTQIDTMTFSGAGPSSSTTTTESVFQAVVEIAGYSSQQRTLNPTNLKKSTVEIATYSFPAPISASRQEEERERTFYSSENKVAWPDGYSSGAPLISETWSFDSQVQRQLQPDEPLMERTFKTEVLAYGNNISVTITSEAAVAQEWLRSQQSNMFGMDLEWRPNKYSGQENKVALLQLCSNRECLMVQMLFLDEMPKGLVDFLLDFEKKIAGVGVKEDAKKLHRDYGLQCNGLVELTVLAAQKLGKSICRKMGLKSLSKEVIGLIIEKPRRITMSDWAKPFLDMRQIEYACIDAWASYTIFEKLMITSNQACSQPAS